MIAYQNDGPHRLRVMDRICGQIRFIHGVEGVVVHTAMLHYDQRFNYGGFRHDAGQSTRMADQNARFLSHLKRLGDQPIGYLAVHFHVSELPTAKKSRDNLSAAIRLFASVKYRYKETELFLLRNLDIIVTTRDIPRHNLAAECASVQEVFVGKMGVTFKNTYGEFGEFYTIFDLGSPADYEKLLAWRRTRPASARRRRH